MAIDIGTLFQVLQNADKQAAADDPYKPLSDYGDQLGGLFLKGAAGGGDIGEALLGGLGAGLFGGVFKGLGRDYVAGQHKLASDSLASILRGGSVLQPEGLSDSVFGPIKSAGDLFGAQQQIDNQQLVQKAKLDLQNKVLGTVAEEAIKNPYRPGAKEILSKLGFGDAGPETHPMVAPSPVQAASSGQGFAPGSGDFGGNPLDLNSYLNADSAGLSALAGTSALQSPQSPPQGKSFSDYMQQYQGDTAVAEAAMKRDLEAPDRNFKDSSDLRNEFQKRPEVASYITSDIGIRSLRNAIKDPSATSDLELVRGAIQAIEPGMAVREGEQAAVSASGSIPDQWKGYLNKALNGESGLPDEVRKGILRIAERRYQEYATTFNQARDFYSTQASQRGLNPDSITYLPRAPVVQPMVQQQNQNPGDVTQSQSGAPLPQTRPGFKLQQNRVTGEFREIPIGFVGAPEPLGGFK